MTEPFAELKCLGWNAAFERAFIEVAQTADIPARVIAVHRDRVVVTTGDSETIARLAPVLLRTETVDARISTGDWVVLRDDDTVAQITRVLPRMSAFVRGAAGTRSVPQVVAANVDYVFIVTALPHDFNARRLERYLAAAWESGATPVIVITKTDLVDDPTPWITDARVLAPGVDVVAISALADTGVERLGAYMSPGKTIALLGSSGVGKSTLVNHQLNRDAMRTKAVDEDGRGRHTTTHRELIRLPGGALVIDTPGMRELQLWLVESGLEQTFHEITGLTAECRFADCGHSSEPGCAVREALVGGTLDRERFESWKKLAREVASAHVRQDPAARIVERAKAKSFERLMRQHMRQKYDG